MTSTTTTELTDAEREAIRQRFLKVDASNVADVLDTLGRFDQGLSPSFLPYAPEAGRLAGWAYTIRGQMTPYPMAGDPEKMRACRDVKPGDVTVWSGDGEGVCYFGELISIGLKERGSVGALVDGGIRDTRWIAKMQFPVFARYRTPVQSIGRWKVNGWQVPVVIRGATSQWVSVAPGDFILADEDGAIAIPADLVTQVLEGAERLTQNEVKLREELVGGLSLEAALKKYGAV